MKNFIFTLVCAIFVICLAINTDMAFAENEKQIEFCFESSVFYYNIDENKKTDSIFYSHIFRKNLDSNNDESRQTTLNKLLSANIPNDVAINYIFPNLNKTIEKMEKYINIKEKDAEMKINTNSNQVFSFTKEQIGRKLDVRQIYLDLTDKILNNQDLIINLKTHEIRPNRFVSEYRSYTNLRADFSTDISSSSAERKHNIKNAIKSINLTILEPNEVFSFNDIVGKRTQENGYRTAKIIVNNEFVEGLGGGICQVSTTLYNSALLAGLDIIEANKHSRPVGYVKSGFDAMVNYGSSDLKFKNNTNNKLIIVANYSSNKIRIRIFGEDLADIKYKLYSEIVETYPSKEIIKQDEKQEYTEHVVYEDEFFYEKKASNGMKVNSYRLKYKSNDLVETEELRTDIFKPIDAIKIYGIKAREPKGVD